ncbi:S-adenosyl-L-methionine-dependent methyltransferase [Gigaspora rosea]|uniref:Ubiquinone biosynthesis O-methyltransferase, mitochondrial n=1 Tax=Gigaspora rosea TaxID=44941 RepID=A0A397UB16_9GLOM|nr:S-adenosyl-L-methionine-dependent methyltransferase [Gigaspora rosea]
MKFIFRMGRSNTFGTIIRFNSKIKRDTIFNLHQNSSSAESSTHDLSSSQYSTINEPEIIKFSQLAKEWWSPNGPVKLLHSMNPLRVSYIRQQLSKYDKEKLKKGQESGYETTSAYDDQIPFKNLRILDIGCGGGVLSESLVRLGASVVGADASLENIQIAKLHARKDPSLYSGPGILEYKCITAEKLLENGESFDIVCAMEIIEHVNHPVEFLKACAGLVKPGGHLFLSTISRTPLSYVLTILLAERVFRIVPNGTHDFNNYLRPDELQQIIERIPNNNVDNSNTGTIDNAEGVDKKKSSEWGQITDITGIGVNPITGKWFEFNHWVPRRIQLDVNYLLTAKRN